MSLGNSKYTYFSLQEAGQDAFKAEVDRFVKEVDTVSGGCHASASTGKDKSPSRKRARYDESQESGYGSQSQPRTQPGVPMSGVILEVTMENFLCHETFHIKLNKRINFVVGRNGSGKSAILTAIIVALGGTASTSGRGTSLKDFVKWGCQSARVTVTLSNTGALNFCREQFGDKIIVVRTIDHLGRSKVELKTEQGKICSTKMQELKRLCLKLGIQVDNPISALDQNTAKTFLLSKPAQLYHLFMKSTDLEALRALFEEIDVHRLQTDQEIRRKKRELETNNAELIEVERKYEIIKSFEKDKIKEDLLKLELLRAQARDCSESVSDAQKALKEAETERKQLEKLLSSDDESKILLEQIKNANDSVKAVTNEQEEVETNFKTFRTKRSDNNKEQKSCESDLKQLEIRMQHNSHMIKEFKAEILSLENKLQPSLVENKRQREDELSLLEQTLKECEKNQVDFKAELLRLDESLNNSNEALVELKKQEKRLTQTKMEKERSLKVLKEDKSNFSRFDPNMTKLMDLIEENVKAGRFKRKPVGPLGSLIRVKDPKWVIAVESAIRARIDNFVVENLDDEKLLKNLMGKIYRGVRPGVLRCRPLEPIDASRNAARTVNYPNVLDMIEVKDVVARNTLIEMFNVEKTLLIPTDDECYHLLKDRQTVPKNCLKAFTLEGACYFPDPQYRTYYGQGKARILEVSQQTLIEGMSSSIAKLQDLLEDIKLKSSSAAVEVQNARDLILRKRNADSQNIVNLIETKNKIETLKDSQVDTHCISTLKEDLAERERRHIENQTLLEKCSEKLERLQNEYRELTDKLKELKESQGILEEQRQLMINKRKKLNEELEKLNGSKADSENKLNQIKKKEEQHVSALKKLEDTFNERNQDAEKFEAHLLSEGVNLQDVSNNRDVRTIDAELKAVTKRRASVEKSFGKNIDDVEKEYYEISAMHKAVQNKIKSLQKNSVYLREALENRQNLYLTQRKYTSCVVSHQFTRVLLQRDCVGSIKVDFENKLLNINVGPIDKGGRAGLGGTSTLSGGERSYATTAFVIALWIVTELPFYYLDEFDVFMDVLVRQTVMALIVKFARLKRGYQFGILTPLDTTDMAEADDLSIWRLENPRDN